MNGIKIVLLSTLLVFMGVNCISAQEKDFSSLEEMRSTFKDTFKEKSVDVDVEHAVVNPDEVKYISDSDNGFSTNITLGTEAQASEHWVLSLIPLLLAIWVAWDASKIGAQAGQAPGFPDFGPVGWFFLTFCCWCIGFPFYLSKRSRYMQANNKTGGGS